MSLRCGVVQFPAVETGLSSPGNRGIAPTQSTPEFGIACPMRLRDHKISAIILQIFSFIARPMNRFPAAPSAVRPAAVGFTVSARRHGAVAPGVADVLDKILLHCVKVHPRRWAGAALRTPTPDSVNVNTPPRR